MEKTELLEALEDGHAEMVELLNDLPDEAMTAPNVSGSWSIKDILFHLTFWEGQMVTLLFQAQKGMPKPTTVHFGKDPLDTVNQHIYDTGKDRPLDVIWQDWQSVRKQTIRRVSEMSEAELNELDRYPWQEGKPLFEWVVNDSVGHEEEHSDAIREWLEAHEGDFSPKNGGGGQNRG